ncbi:MULTISPECIES: SDR family NAD(P)-dependent oxidoreductase [unclassified Methylobacterium]|uniref:SDR family NAD(P)-dependent oxidoreductase n=1 Tax=unclassified Methylobacterium TaxID=2615210 RepID=UPI0011C201DD|nr:MULTISPECIES: SDR family NAD(P)-dependent oxidoreductase [unclassified Methylobacterium]QEE39046.1 SDR family NAD(P)-dependent oxidoreductase [Methylobacterium sp. WL1]TXN56747.1 SDR family NAD(P)-dependent oxidoreductase [Methylobacterium sp. WL2]
MNGSDSAAATAMVRIWSETHQTAFARATGDVNPMHMDARVAQRTLAGGRAVHGVHVALWALDAYAEIYRLEELSSLQMRFERFVLVGDRTELAVHGADAQGLRLSLSVDGVRAATIQATLGGARPRAEPVAVASGAIPTEPAVVEPGTIAGATGAFRLPDPEAIAALVPQLSRAIGPARVAALGGLSTLVGMLIPGLHSILSKIDVTLTDGADGSSLAYTVKRFQPMLQSVTTQASGPGLEARVESFVRPRPVEPESLAGLAALVRPGEFSAVSALVVGGSRGLGAATAKLLAAGGGDVCITYASSASEAEAVAEEIRNGGGRCQVLRYDAVQPVAPQLGSVVMQPSQLYHFATPRIFRQKRAAFEPSCFEEMMRVYNYAFYDLSLFCLERRDRVAAFYPSTTAIDEAPRDTLEYVMAKTAGETLAATLARTIPNLRTVIERLPRVKTDQTATIFPVPAASPGGLMLPIIRRLSSDY